MGERRMTCKTIVKGSLQERFSASTGWVKLICVPVRMVTGPLSLLLKQAVLGCRELSASPWCLLCVCRAKGALREAAKLGAAREPRAQEGEGSDLC